MRRMRIGGVVLGAVLLTLLTGGFLPAAEYPQKPVQIIVCFPPGGPADLSTRALAEAAKPFFPKPFTAVNRPGGGGVLGTSEMVRSAPDGYTLCQVDISAVAVGPHLEPGLPYKGPEDIQYIISHVTAHNGFAVRADAPWKNMQELIDHAKANPGKVRVGNAGLGATTHLHFMSLKVAGVPMTEVPFAGAAPAVTALLGGHIEGVVLNLTPVLPHVRAGKLKWLALFTNEQLDFVPELKGVPTFKELGYGNTLAEGTSYSIAAPRATPKSIIDILYDTLLKAQKSDFFQKFGRENLLAIELKGPAELKREAEKAYAFYGDFIKKTNLKTMLKK